MISFLQSPWVSGIGGGIISGIIVFYITKWIMGRKDNKEHQRQIQSANQDVITILKPYIADNGLPNKNIMSSIINSTARKYGVKAEEMYDPKVFCEELIREIVSNVYVSLEKKKEYTQQLIEYKAKLEPRQRFTPLGECPKTEKSKSRYNSVFSLTLSILTVLITFTSIVLFLNDFSSSNGYSDNFLFIFIIVGTTSIIAIVSLIIGISFHGPKSSKRKSDKNKKKDDDVYDFI